MDHGKYINKMSREDHMKRKFFIVLVSVVVLAVGVVALFLNSNYYYSKKLVSAIRDKDMVAVRQIIEKNPTCINTYPALTSKWWHSAMNWRVCYPLNEACATGNIDLIELLIDNGADVNCNDGLTPLAISHCDTDLAELLLRYGGTLSHIYRSLSYALHNHGVEGLKEMYELLDRSHALSEDKNGEMIKMAARMSDKEAVEYLVSTLDLKPTWTGSDGKTLLHLCAASGFESEDKKVEFATFLIANGVSRSACDDQGKTAYDYAVERDLGSLAEILKP